MNREEIIARLTAQYGYPPGGAQKVADRLEKCGLEVLQAFAAWWQTGSLPEISVCGYTPARLQEEHGMNPVAAFLTLDWLVKDPRQALASLSKGHDRIIRK